MNSSALIACEGASVVELLKRLDAAMALPKVPFCRLSSSSTQPSLRARARSDPHAKA
jgi:hypothetical protein